MIRFELKINNRINLKISLSFCHFATNHAGICNSNEIGPICAILRVLRWSLSSQQLEKSKSLIYLQMVKVLTSDSRSCTSWFLNHLLMKYGFF